jgi:hypothetical protein
MVRILILFSFNLTNDMSRYISEIIKKQLLDETIHRCGLCLSRVGVNSGEYDIAHITPHCETGDNSYENLIVLCVSCHSDYTRNLENNEETLRLKNIKKYWLSLGKYYQIELDCLFDLYLDKDCLWIVKDAVKSNGTNISSLRVSEDNLFLFKNIIQDQLVQLIRGNGGVSIGGMSVSPIYLVFTEHGRNFCKKLLPFK